MTVRQITYAIQAMMQANAVRRREYKSHGATRKTSPSPLAGRLFDETGDRLTPSHSKSKTGVRVARAGISAGSGGNPVAGRRCVMACIGMALGSQDCASPSIATQLR